MPLLIAVFLVGPQAPNQSEEPHNPQKLVSPSEYRGIPKEVRDFLEQQHCQLPEAPNYDRHAINVVSSHFVEAKQTDWAALCVVKRSAESDCAVGRQDRLRG